MCAMIRVNVEPFSAEDAMRMIKTGNEYLIWKVDDAEEIVRAKGINPAEVDPAADTATARIVAFLAVAEKISEIEEAIEHICNNIPHAFPSSSDFEEFDEEDE